MKDIARTRQGRDKDEAKTRNCAKQSRRRVAISGNSRFQCAKQSRDRNTTTEKPASSPASMKKAARQLAPNIFTKKRASLKGAQEDGRLVSPAGWGRGVGGVRPRGRGGDSARGCGASSTRDADGQRAPAGRQAQRTRGRVTRRLAAMAQQHRLGLTRRRSAHSRKLPLRRSRCAQDRPSSWQASRPQAERMPAVCGTYEHGDGCQWMRASWEGRKVP